ncbi:hypothetical protein ACFHW2_12275 [Actinomadura sp. LOL_016]|uniref:zinc finger domain-containing protein n=1 Tax=unclassified Actinomadura TaxID=2626254 RepID=UPI003A7FEFEF
MAYAEKRGRYWRGRYRNPPGVIPRWGTVSAQPDGAPFTRRNDALKVANRKEAEISEQVAQWEGPPAEGLTLDEWKRALAGKLRARGQKDPYAGDVLLRDWAMKVWLPAQDIEEGSYISYEQHLRLRILPAFGDDPVNSLYSREEVQAWEIALRKRYSANVVENCRSLLATILGDAQAAGLVDVNAAARRGNRRGRVSVRRLTLTAPPKKWLTPLEMLLLAERAAVLTGRPDDFVMWTVCGWCGLRWGELMGLQRPALLGAKLRIDVQLTPPNGGPFKLRPPKDGSVRNDHPRFFGCVDLPPFLIKLLARHIAERPPADCGCGCGGAKFLFLNERRTHHFHGTYESFPWSQAADGVVPGRPARPGRAAGSPDRPVMVDCSEGFPGRPLSPAWPAAEGPDWSPPVIRGMARYDEPITDVLAVDCPRCPARKREPCRTESGLNPNRPHRPRFREAEAQGHVRELELASWLPLKPGLTPHGLRHSHRVLLDDIGTPEVLAYDRLGHSKPGIGGTYSHVSETMRARLRERLEARWKTTLDERLAIAPGSSVPLLDELLSERRRAA